MAKNNFFSELIFFVFIIFLSSNAFALSEDLSCNREGEGCILASECCAGLKCLMGVCTFQNNICIATGQTCTPEGTECCDSYNFCLSDLNNPGSYICRGSEGCADNPDPNKSCANRFSNTPFCLLSTSSCVECLVSSDCDAGKACKNNECVSTCTDKDGDGYGMAGSANCPNKTGVDCDDNNKNVYPLAKEICWGNVNEDCMADGVDCSDSECSFSPYCASCSVDSDCPQDANCFSMKCNSLKKCEVKSTKCANDGVCCYPACNLTSDKTDCVNTCSQIRDSLYGSQTISFMPRPGSGVGSLRGYGDGSISKIKGFNERVYDSITAGIFNKWAELPCDNEKFSRGFIIIDTECLDESMPIASANLIMDDRKGEVLASFYVDKSNYSNDNNSWIINPSTFATATRGLDAYKISPGKYIETYKSTTGGKLEGTVQNNKTFAWKAGRAALGVRFAATR